MCTGLGISNVRRGRRGARLTRHLTQNVSVSFQGLQALHPARGFEGTLQPHPCSAFSLLSYARFAAFQAVEDNRRSRYFTVYSLLGHPKLSKTKTVH